MQGTIIHYDELTRCGLLRDEAGRVRYFRREDLPENAVVADNLTIQVDVSEEGRPPVVPVTLTNPPVVPADEVLPVRAEVVPERYEPYAASEVPAQRGGWLNWPGSLIALAALIALALSGNEPSPRGGRTPALLESFWGILTAVMLALASYLFGSGTRRWLVRLLYWPIVLCTGMAFWMQSCDGFEGDTASETYLYLLAALFVAAYLLPYRRR
ncbi:hypothetical protein [Tellurirhabdus rosea]|uniref:hypothetical protein n=1 Tax=Tellurirhabdus rosea TaxID=2674997 RepID=UPI00224EAD7B|nr:hypothetical protein [Tellurirhabdus rosea]